MEPIFKNRIWGGETLTNTFGLVSPSDKIGEAWVVSGHSTGDSRIVNGEWSGKTLSQIYSMERNRFGQGTCTRFPLIVKIIDAMEDLSIQVHPNNEYAKQFENDSGKTECWYVLNCESNSRIIIGHNAKSKEELIKLIYEKNFSELLSFVPIKKDDVFLIPSGTIHAICKGTIIYEVQQNSDITYRIFDYNRLDEDGKLRKLDIEKAIDVIEIPSRIMESKVKTKKLKDLEIALLIDCPLFSMKKVTVSKKGIYHYQEEFLIVGCLRGSGIVNGINVQDTIHFIVLNGETQLEIIGDLTLMIIAPHLMAL